jgi:hypothetical protein
MPQYQHFMNDSRDILSFRYVLALLILGHFPIRLQVRGTPGSGKTVLAQLLAEYVSEQEPDVDVIWVQAWPINKVKYIGHRAYLRHLGWKEGQKTVFIFDDAEKSYQDWGLWNAFFKSIHDYDDRCAIAFSSYGSPCSWMTTAGTKVRFLVCDSQRVSLRPIDHGDGFQPVGLFFSRLGFGDLISTLCSANHFFHQSFLDAIFDLTGGHVGAIQYLVRTIAAHDVGLLSIDRADGLTRTSVVSSSQAWPILYLGTVFNIHQPL